MNIVEANKQIEELTAQLEQATQATVASNGSDEVKAVLAKADATSKSFKESIAKYNSVKAESNPYDDIAKQAVDRTSDSNARPLMDPSKNSKPETQQTTKPSSAWDNVLTLKDPQPAYEAPKNDPYTQEVTGGGNFYFLPKTNLYLAYLKDGTVVLKKYGDNERGFRPLVMWNLETDLYGNVTWTNVPKSVFDSFMKQQPTFEQLTKAYRLMQTPQFDLATTDAQVLW